MWFFYALASPFLASITNFIEKFFVEKKIKDPSTITIFNGIIAYGIGILFFTLQGFPIIPLPQILLLILIGIFLELYLVPYFKALSLDDPSTVVPLFQVIPIFVFILSFIFLHESLNNRQFAGFVCIIVGGFILSAEKVDKKIFSLKPAFWYMMLSSFLYAIVGVIFKFVTFTQSYWVTVPYQLFGIGIGAFLLFIFSKEKTHLKEDIKKLDGVSWVLFLGNQCISLIAQFSELFAVSLAPVSLVAIVSGSQPIFLLIFGVIFTVWFPKFVKEDIRRSTIGKKLITVITIIIGLSLIYL